MSGKTSVVSSLIARRQLGRPLHGRRREGARYQEFQEVAATGSRSDVRGHKAEAIEFAMNIEIGQASGCGQGVSNATEI